MRSLRKRALTLVRSLTAPLGLRVSLFFLLSAALAAAAQVYSPEQRSALDTVTIWKVVNTAIFAIGLGWIIAKYAPRFFNARSADIQKAIQDATGLKIEADFRYSEIDRKMATLSEEVKRIRDEAAIEMEREHERIRRATEFELQQIHARSMAEIDALRGEGVRQVRQRTAHLALALAERRLRERAGAVEPSLFDDFIHLVERSKN